MHRTSSRFWILLENLPEGVRTAARKNFEILKYNPSHPSLHFKKVGNLWSVRVGLHHRALATQNDADYIWFWIGSHDEYDRLIERLG
jgi:hypothetical protein